MYVDVIYDSFTVDKYNGGRNDGITLNFIEPSTNLIYFTIYNVKRKGAKGILKFSSQYLLLKMPLNFFIS